MSLQSIPDRLLARVAKFSLCDNEICRFSSDRHLVVSMHSVEVRRGNAVATSYTWGAFNRKRVTLGHTVKMDPVVLELGEEWLIPDLITTLASLGKEKGSCWIDQLSIPQQDDEIRQVLATIPSIYRSFDVVALMPGRPCKCLRQAIELGEAMATVEAKGLTEIGPHHLAFIRHVTRRMGLCINAASSSSWFDRIWTRQELMYSRKINVAWTSMEDAKCVRIPEVGWANVRTNFEDLTPYGAALFASLPKDHTDYEVVLKLSNHHSLFMQSGAMALMEYIGRPGDILAEALLCRFLNGEVITSGLPDITLQDDHENLRKFIGELGIVAGSTRSATEARDYVAAIWVDCPRYRIPDMYKSLDLADLIQDAFDQLKENFGITLPSNAPNGLFQNQNGSGLWNPSYYVRQATILDLKHVYGPLASNDLRAIPLVGASGLPLAFSEPNAEALSSADAMNYEDIIGAGLPVSMILEALKRIAQYWPLDIVSAWSNDLGDRVSQYKRLVDSEKDKLIFEQQILSKNTFAEGGRSLSTTNLYEHRIQHIEGVDHHTVVYHMVTAVLGLDEHLCRQKGLKLILGPKGIGLSRRDIRYGTPSPDNGNMAGAKDIITVALGNATDVYGRKLVEAERVAADGPTPRYRVFAIWVPSAAVEVTDIGATVQEGATDAVLD